MSERRKKTRKNRYKKPAVKKGRRLSLKLNPVPFLMVSGSLVIFSVLTYALIVSYSLITQCSVFNTKEISVTGNKRLSYNDILRQAHIKTGDNIFGINLKTTRERLLDHSWVKKAEVIREMPDTIHIRISEHVPFTIVDFGKKYLVNTEGEIFKKLGDEPEPLAVVAGMLPEDFNVAGRRIIKNKTKPHKAVMDILDVINNVRSGSLSAKISKIYVDREIGLTLVSEGNIKQVKLGYGNYRKKIQRFFEVTEILNKKASLVMIDTIDLNNINRIVVKPAPTEAKV